MYTPVAHLTERKGNSSSLFNSADRRVPQVQYSSPRINYSVNSLIRSTNGTRNYLSPENFDETKVDLENTKKQISKLQNEIYGLQADNAVLLTQLEEQTACVSALVFDFERIKTRLEEHKIEIPESVYHLVINRIQSQNVSSVPHVISGKISETLLEHAELTEDERLRFFSLQDLVTAVNDLQVRLRESHLLSTNACNEKAIALEKDLLSAKQEYSVLLETKGLIEKRFSEEMTEMARQREHYSNRITSLETEVSDLVQQCESLREKENLEIEKLNLKDKEDKIKSLHDDLISTIGERDALSSASQALHTAKLMIQKELEYFTASLEREREYSTALRAERDTTLDELNHARTIITETTSEVTILQGKLDILERINRSKDTEIENWKSRATITQDQLSDESARWDISMKDAMRRCSTVELSLASSQSRITQLENDLATKSQEINELEKAKLDTEQKYETKLHQLEQDLSARHAEIFFLKQQNDTYTTQLELNEKKRQVLVEQLLTIENQANLLKERHPQLDFEVMEEELNKYQEEKRRIEEEFAMFNEEIERLKAKLLSTELLLAATKESFSSVETIKRDLELREIELKNLLESKDTKITNLENQLSKETARCNFLIEANQESTNKLTQLEQEKHEKEESLENLKDQSEKELKLIEAKLEEAQHATKINALTIEDERQAYRLEIQTHSRDLEELHRLQEELSKFRRARSEELAQLESRLKENESRILKLLLELAESKRRNAYTEADRQLICEENSNLRQLLEDKHNSLELSEDDLKAQVLELLRNQESLRKETDQARIEAERSRLETQSVRDFSTALQSRYDKVVAELETVKNELLSSNRITNVEESYQQQIALLQVRFDRLSQELKFTAEMKRNLEKRIESLLAETEPIRRREAILQGETESLKHMLVVTETSAQAYKQKYLTAVKGLQTELEEKIENMSTLIQNLQKELNNEQLLRQEAEATQEQSKTIAEQLKSSVERLTQENTSLKAQQRTLTGQVQTLQLQRTSAIESTEIQKRYQVQVSNLQRLLQQVNQEKEQLKHEILKSEQSLLQEQQTRARSTQLFKNEVQSLKNELSMKQPTHLQEVVQESLKVGVLATFLGHYISRKKTYELTCQQTFADTRMRSPKINSENKSHDQTTSFTASFTDQENTNAQQTEESNKEHQNLSDQEITSNTLHETDSNITTAAQVCHDNFSEQNFVVNNNKLPNATSSENKAL